MADDNPIRGNKDIRRRRIIKLESLPQCPFCHVNPGQPHQIGCRIERCSVCGEKRYRCCEDKPSSRLDTHPEHDRAFARWTGIIPGDLETNYMSMSEEEFEPKFGRIFFVKPKL